jgi:hypothetical protein
MKCCIMLNPNFCLYVDAYAWDGYIWILSPKEKIKEKEKKVVAHSPSAVRPNQPS